MIERPRGSNVDEWHLFLCQHLDPRAARWDGLEYMALQIAEAIDQAFEDGRDAEYHDVNRSRAGGQPV
jgi:hypothetical protein